MGFKRDELCTLNDFQRFLGEISSLQPTVEITTGLIVQLNKTLDGNKELNNSKYLTAKVEK